MEQRGPVAAQSTLRVVGPTDIVVGGRPIAIPGPQHRKLLAVLALNANEWMARDAVISVLWPDDSDSDHVAALHSRISELRGAIRRGGAAAPVVATAGSGYRLEIDAMDLDASQFAVLCRRGHRMLAAGDIATATATLTQARSLWRGHPYQELSDQPIAMAEVARLTAIHTQLMEDLVDIELEEGHHAELASDLLTLVEQHPVRERLWAQLMLAQYRAGLHSAALTTYDRLRRNLRDELGTSPSAELQELHQQVLHADVPATIAAASREGVPLRAGNLPGEISSFLGRKDELAELEQLTREFPVVSIVGVGGSGKTRLAVELGHRERREYANGVWFLSLVDLTDPALIDRALADIFGVTEQPVRPLLDLVVDEIRDAQALLIFDNCEHVLSRASSVIRKIAIACPKVRILATSREPLALTGGRVIGLDGLTIPATHDPAAALQADSVRLFVDRAKSANVAFAADADVGAALARIVRQLDGLPLAIELVAAQCSTFGVDQLADHLHDHLSALEVDTDPATAKQQSLGGAIGWSYDLLSPADRGLFRALSVFESGFTVDGAEAVWSTLSRAGAIAAIGRLSVKSLIARDTAEPGRFRMLETVRVFAADRLRGEGEWHAVSVRHAQFFQRVAELTGSNLRSSRQAAAVDRLESEHANIRVALAWCLDHGDHGGAASMAAALYPFWDLHGYYSEGRQWLHRALAGPGEELPAELRIRCLMGVSTLASIQGDVDAGGGACQQAYELATGIGGRAGISHALQYMGFGLVVAGEAQEAIPVLIESRLNGAMAGDTWLQGWALIQLGGADIALRNGLDATEHADAAIEVLGPDGDPEGLAWACLINAAAFTQLHHLETARRWARRALQGFASIGGLWGLSITLVIAAITADAAAPAERAELLGSSGELRTRAGAGELPVVAQMTGQLREELEVELGQEATVHAMLRGTVGPWFLMVDQARTLIDLSASSH